MKKLFTLVVAVCSFLLNVAYANIYASGIRISDPTVTDYNNAGKTWDGNVSDGSGVKIWFVINEAGVGSITATVTVKQGNTTIKTLNVSSPVKGINNVLWDGTDNSAAIVSAGTYSFEVTVNDPTGHSTFDSLWVAGARYAGTDLDGGTSYGDYILCLTKQK